MDTEWVDCSTRSLVNQSSSTATVPIIPPVVVMPTAVPAAALI